MKRTGGQAPLGGWVESGFEPVREAFAENFAERGEVGAAFAATLDGRPVVDLWGGAADSASGRCWQQDTLQLIFSGTKGLTALCMAMLIDRGRMKLEDPVCLHWPEFGAHGKESVSIAEIVSHRGRLPAVRTPLIEQDLLDPQRLAALLADQSQESDPRAEMIYHALTYGWLCGEIVRRVEHRSIGRFFAEEVAGPLGLELWIGLPAEMEERVAVLQYGSDWVDSPIGRADSFPGDELWESAYENPAFFLPRQGPMLWNLPELHATEMPGANAIGATRSIARLYGALSLGGEVDGVRVISPQGLALARTPLSQGTDPLLEDSLAFGVGFQLQTDDAPLGPAKAAFGHCGAGGSCHGAWPQERVGFSYAMNDMRTDLTSTPRANGLLEALYECVGGHTEAGVSSAET